MVYGVLVWTFGIGARLLRTTSWNRQYPNPLLSFVLCFAFAIKTLGYTGTPYSTGNKRCAAF